MLPSSLANGAGFRHADDKQAQELAVVPFHCSRSRFAASPVVDFDGGKVVRICFQIEQGSYLK